ncbi:indolepyruvate ferredoxin oxidoreductase family protein [Pseudomaricurvus alkylphenolicus]|uniref:indolepyruvate ferredoxin oxidoreductase family protein n=1 Tax=Pseudomaricurvus alkylphenolicus TaxID=1306991 RepID=UPI001422C482|nr:indolepyruvate ferredoxin oxidoreductase family protein [Pseudomaricurvus alkylphenolicus]NIB43615.1 indolepyruvate ferredoxin oxidoreductase family protein [Pseudomaricurvus alkylphenolicus]
MTATPPENKKISLSDRFTVEKGRVLLSGIQALVRLPMEQMRRDRARDLNTGVFISGYRGSPLGGYDLQLTRNKPLLDDYNIKFQPGVNEELGATAVWGSQQVNLFEGATVDGVCGIWYGKTPGVDRSTDAFRHGNAAGSSENGGVLVVAGDDHGCKSSSYPGQSEFAFVDMHMPVLNPANVQEVLDYGLYGIELSRFSGCWVAMVTLTENMDSAATVEVDPERVQIEHPDDVEMPEGGLNIRLGDTPLAQEERLWRYKRPAALAFCRKNKLNKVVLDNPDAKLGIVTAGKAHLDLMQAMDELGIDETKAKALGIRILKVGMTYPLDVAGIREFARGLDYLFVVEEKRSLMEVQLKEELYNVEVVDPNFPKIIGKLDSQDNPLLPAYGELSPAIVADVLLRALPGEYRDEVIEARLETLKTNRELANQCQLQTQRSPFFCSGCPHNTSTKLPEGSRALAGIGCHYLVQTMERDTHTFTQMGGEGVSWIGQSHFTETPHVFVNLGDGTYFHSGVLAIRASIAAKVNITYKILYNEAVAMTGGQPHDGELRPDMIAAQVLAEGVEKLVVVMDDVNKYRGKLQFPSNAEIRQRDELDEVQRELREVKGVTCILYDQTCATELRRKRKRGVLPDPKRRAFINDLVCEGCGDCSVQSNCISVEPKETEFGTKRQINQTTCNKDISCVKGFCPSFVTVEGGELRKPESVDADFIALGESLPQPSLPSLETPWSVLVTGIGGTGVVTVGALMSMAAYIEGKAATTLDQTGLAQKGGSVYSHIRLANHNDQLHAVRISDASADALIACDLVAASVEATCVSKLNKDKTLAVINSDVMPTSAFVLGKNIGDESQQMMDLIDTRSARLGRVDGTGLTQQALGSTTTANIFMLGYAWQMGAVPLALESLYQAIELNGVAILDNKRAFNAGRLACAEPAKLQQILRSDNTEETDVDISLDAMVARRVEFLGDYQDQNYSNRYRKLVQTVHNKEQQVAPGSETLSRAVARFAFKLMAYKDEYEVARLYSDGRFQQQLKEAFTGDYQLTYHLSPPLLAAKDKQSGRPRKLRFGPWMGAAFKLLTKFKGLRGTAFDVFGYHPERKQERRLIESYFATIEKLLTGLRTDNLEFATQIASLPDGIRGYGPVKQASLREVCGRWQVMVRRFEQGETGHREGVGVQQVDFSLDQLPG